MIIKQQEELETTISNKQVPRVSSVTRWTAFWASLVATLLLISTIIPLEIMRITSVPLIIAAIVALVSTILLVIRSRWTTLVATLLQAYLLVSTWTSPIVMDSLSSPKGQIGGLGHSISDELVACITILAFVCSLGTTIQYFRGSSQKTPRWYTVALNLVIGLTIGIILMSVVSLPPSVTGTSMTNGVPTVHMNATTFLQKTVTLSKGDKLLLVDDAPVEHILFNGSWQNGAPHTAQEQGAPTVNGIILNKNSTTIGPFVTAGTYHIYCSLHPTMDLTIIVQ